VGLVEEEDKTYFVAEEWFLLEESLFVAVASDGYWPVMRHE
jgi:hypothetical protein